MPRQWSWKGKGKKGIDDGFGRKGQTVRGKGRKGSKPPRAGQWEGRHPLSCILGLFTVLIIISILLLFY
jgi:hypothetical protein